MRRLPVESLITKRLSDSEPFRIRGLLNAPVRLGGRMSTERVLYIYAVVHIFFRLRDEDCEFRLSVELC